MPDLPQFATDPQVAPASVVGGHAHDSLRMAFMSPGRPTRFLCG
jgi:hypothetical protein